MTRRFYPELEALRGLAAVLVVALHANLVFGLPGFQSPQNIRQIFTVALFPGNSSVVLFFVLSGFVLSHSLPSGLRATIEYLPVYVIRRLLRLIPAMWVAIGFSALVNVALGHGLDGQAALRAMIFADYQIDPPMWSLRPEFYLAIFALPVLAILTPRLGLIGNAVVQAGLAYYCTTHWDDVMSYTYAFHLGCMVPSLGRWVIDRLHGAWALVAFSASIVTFAFASPALTIFGAGVYNDIVPFMAFPSFLFVSYFFARPDGIAANVMRIPVVRFCGVVSYSAYLLHWPVRIVMREVYLPHVPEVLTALPAVSQILFIILTVTISFALASLCYRFVERPFINLGKSIHGFKPSWRGVDATASASAGTSGYSNPS